MCKEEFILPDTNIVINTRRPIMIIAHRYNTINNIDKLCYNKDELYTALIVLTCKMYKFMNNVVLFVNPMYKLNIKYSEKDRHTHQLLIRCASFCKIRVLYGSKGLIKCNFRNSALFHREVMIYPIKYSKNNSISFMFR
jgi:hypothetical protein